MKPMTAKINPPDLNWLSFISSNFFNILFIFDGNMAYKIPSINKNRPKAMINSFIKILLSFWFYVSKKFKEFTIRR